MLAEVEAQLVAEAPELKLVAGAAEFSAIKANPPKSKQPAAYVLPVSETASANRVAVNAIRQRNTIRFAVLLALGNLSDRRASTATKALEALIVTVRGALLGWQPTTDHEMVQYVGGSLVDVRNGVVWWQLDFNTVTHLRG